MKKTALIVLSIFYSCWSFSQTTITLQPGATGKDAHVWSLEPATYNGNSIYMGATAWTWSSAFGIMRTLVDFDLSAIPAGAQITSAKLSLYNHNIPTMPNGDNALYIKRITSSWLESTVTWNNKPTTSETNRVSVPAFASGNMENVSVTTLVQDMISDRSNSHGFQIMLQTEDIYRTFNIASSDHATASLHPKLEITYTALSNCITLQPAGDFGKDTHVWSLEPTNNNPNSIYIGATAWTWNSAFGIMRTLIDFDLSSIPAGAEITDAELSLYHFDISTMDNGDNALFIKRITSPWEENTVTWNNKPTTTETNKVSVPAFAMGEDLENVNVTSLVQDMQADLSGSHGFQIMLQTESIYRTFNMASSDNATASLRPKLEVCYTTLSGLISGNRNDASELGMKVYPNPANENSAISFTLPKSAEVTIELVSAEGRTLQTLVTESFSQGEHTVPLNIEKVSNQPGLYLVKVLTGDKVYTQKLIIK